MNDFVILKPPNRRISNRFQWLSFPFFCCQIKSKNLFYSQNFNLTVLRLLRCWEQLWVKFFLFNELWKKVFLVVFSIVAVHHVLCHFLWIFCMFCYMLIQLHVDSWHSMGLFHCRLSCIFFTNKKVLSNMNKNGRVMEKSEQLQKKSSTCEKIWIFTTLFPKQFKIVLLCY